MFSSTSPETPGLRFAPGFRDSLRHLAKDDRASVWDAINRFGENPGLPGLNLKRLKAVASEIPLWSIRASRELRVLLRREGPTSTFVHAGHHDETYAKAVRTRFADADALPDARQPEATVEPATAVSLDASERHSKPTAYSALPYPQETHPDEPDRPLLWMWASADMLEVFAARDDLGDVTVEQATALVNATDDDGDDVLLRYWPGDDKAALRKKLLDLLLEDLAELLPADWRAQQLSGAEAAAVERYARDITERGAAAALSITLSADEVKRLAAAPIEDWMIFLHPAQRDLVERRFSGPARVNGSAGTGKTSIALHRAARLAKHPPEQSMFGGDPHSILFTTYIASLPPVLENLYSRLPTAVEGAVEFVNVDALAKRLCEELDALGEGVGKTINIARSKSAFARAKKDVVRPSSPLHALGLSDDYLRDEVTKVIIGRDIADVETYRNIARHGREVPFQHRVRDQMWDLHVAWRDLMNDDGIEHFEDRLRRARDYVRSLPRPRYRSVIVDESQDLTQMGLEVLIGLVAERVPTATGAGHDLVLGPDALLLVGDAAQRVYPGGFALSDAGVEIRGRSEVLGVNYRNTRQIIEAAMACTGGQRILDPADEDAGSSGSLTASVPPPEQSRRRSDAEWQVDRDHGVTPRLVIAADSGAERRYVADEINRLTAMNEALSPGDFGVFAATNNHVDAAISLFRQEGLDCVNLKDFVGEASEEIRVGTFDRAKGLEFKVVFLLGVSHRAWPFTAKSGLSTAERDDAESLATTKLFVAMTRARDALYVVCSEKPHSLLDQGRAHFEIIRWPEP